MKILIELVTKQKIKCKPPAICITGFGEDYIKSNFKVSGFDYIIDKCPKKETLIEILKDVRIIE